MKLRIEIDMDNAAFEDDPQPEVCRILREYIKAGRLEKVLMDVNGNRVGRAEVEGD